MTYELAAICDACKQAVGDGDGNLWLDMAEVEQATVNKRAWEQLETDHSSPGFVKVSFSAHLSHPEPARWQVHHSACDPAPDANAYAIEVHRCRSWADLVLWTAHLMGKGWFPHTDWDELLEAAGESAGSRITPTTRPTLHR
ncbi:hypothetical protein [Streptacidiphilus jiangxiensis]|uniref:hypothetical protein n=1 Tax=Streptacidiphilus jiangxiensis TaxID=235985 RepID=UPI0011609425|nr:hypothetical protein [Streptacidiphilus jiangxiensis]